MSDSSPQNGLGVIEVAGGRSSRPGELFGHPTCLFTLFFAEMWERFSFYGMKALLILYMVNYLFWKQGEASHVMAWYAGLVYATPVIGGIIADKWLGARWSVVVGGVIIAIGHFLLAFEPMPFFYSGLGCLVVGTGFLKPNISTQVGALYRTADQRRDSAFTIFYMGINTGAFLGPIVCGWLRFNYGYHYGFAAAGVGMVLGLIVYIWGMGRVVQREKQIAAEEEAAATAEPETAAPAAEAPSADGTGRSRIYFDRGMVLVVICVFAILFWVGFEQAANVMNLWADKHTNLHVFQDQAPMVEVGAATSAADADPSGAGIAQWQMTAEQSQSINPLFIIIFAGVFAWLWEFLDRRGMQPSTPMKMAFGVFFLSCAYGIMLLAAQAENKASSAQLVELPRGLQVDARDRVFSVEGVADAEEHTFYGATRLRWKEGTLNLNGVLTDLDWMRAMSATCSDAHRETIERLAQAAEDKAEEARVAKKAGGMARDATWEVSITVPDEAGEIEFIAGLPTRRHGQDVALIASWSHESRTLTISETLSDKDQAQLLAAGSEPGFRAALTQIYQNSSVLKVSLVWLLAFYLVLTIGELCLSPVGLSLVTKAAHPAYVGLFMGLWFLTTGAVANFLAHFAGGYWGTMVPAQYFIIFGITGVAATLIMLLMLRVLRPMLHGIH